MKVHEVMTALVGIISPENSIVEAARKMKNMNVGALPVYGESGLVGIVTDRDIAIRSSAEGHNPQLKPVESIMTRSVAYVLEDVDIEVAARLMEEKQIRRLPVLNSKSKIVGIVSLGDIAWRCDCRLAGETMRRICVGPLENNVKSPTLD